MFYLGETCGSQICVREYPMTGSQMTVFTSYNQIHCWVDQNKMKNIISFSISLISVILFSLTFILPTSGENRAAVAILAMATLIANQVVAIWAIPAAQNAHYAHIAAERKQLHEIFDAPMEQHRRNLRELDEFSLEIRRINCETQEKLTEIDSQLIWKLKTLRACYDMRKYIQHIQ